MNGTRTPFSCFRRKAFSLIEAVIAIAILGILCAEIFSLFSQGNAGTIRVQDEIVAINYAVSVLNYCKSLPMSHELLKECEKKPMNSLASGNRSIANLSDEYACEFSVKTGKSPDIANYTYKVLVIRVAWKSGGVSRSISLSDMCYGATPSE